MAEAWERDLDRQKMDPDCRDEYQRELDQECEASKSIDDYYNNKVVVDPTRLNYKPGQHVKWLGKKNAHKEGQVIGAYMIGTSLEPTYVIMEGWRNIVEVDETELMFGWEGPPTLTPAPDTGEVSTDPIPF